MEFTTCKCGRTICRGTLGASFHVTGAIVGGVFCDVTKKQRAESNLSFRLRMIVEQRRLSELAGEALPTPLPN